MCVGFIVIFATWIKNHPPYPQQTNFITKTPHIMRTSILLFIFLLPGIIHAQRIVPKEPALIDVYYRHKTERDTARRDSVARVDNMLLRAGRTMSAYFSPERYHSDSLREVNPELCFELFMKRLEESRTNGGKVAPFRAIFKNYPEGKLTENDRFEMMGWQYSEDWEKPQWELLDSAKTILGYECQLAQTDFRGRHWSAWFTPDIPISDGPWKLCGLPGLILEAYDTARDYEMTAFGMITPSGIMAGYFDYNDKDRATTKRDIFFRDKHRNMNRKNPTVFVLGEVKKVKETPHNYDFEETTYPH